MRFTYGYTARCYTYQYVFYAIRRYIVCIIVLKTYKDRQYSIAICVSFVLIQNKHIMANYVFILSSQKCCKSLVLNDFLSKKQLIMPRFAFMKDRSIDSLDAQNSGDEIVNRMDAINEFLKVLKKENQVRRKELGWNQGDAGEAWGCHTQTISKYESGKGKDLTAILEYILVLSDEERMQREIAESKKTQPEPTDEWDPEEVGLALLRHVARTIQVVRSRKRSPEDLRADLRLIYNDSTAEEKFQELLSDAD